MNLWTVNSKRNIAVVVFVDTGYWLRRKMCSITIVAFACGVLRSIAREDALPAQRCLAVNFSNVSQNRPTEISVFLL